MKPITSAPPTPVPRPAPNRGHGCPNSPRSTPLGETMILSPRQPPRDQVAGSPSHDGDRIGPPTGPAFQRAGRPVSGASRRARAVADRRILPEGANLIDQRQPPPPCYRQPGQRVRAPGNARAGCRAGTPPPARSIARICAASPAASPSNPCRKEMGVRWKVRPSTVLDLGLPHTLPGPVTAATTCPAPSCAFRMARVRKVVAALQGQTMVEDMQDTHREKVCHASP